eukprot:TRINITY_DN12920_c0_g1_i1.p1 TRINITY_DN12920_c0_g1~~TRINITY_DN12920_c0_g1_i1.p1  ORF type:complete len:457 (+),score=82.08 TRINITY_DN12920_c0_g1_i1:58-1371(+)
MSADDSGGSGRANARIALSKTKNVLVSEHQVNPGWQGARSCAHIADKWASIPKVEGVPNYQSVMIGDQATLSSFDAATIDAALDLKPLGSSSSSSRVPPRKGQASHRVGEVPLAVEPLSLPAAPSYGMRMGRAKLGNVLRAFSLWKPAIGYNTTIASLAASIMAVVGYEKTAFHILASVYVRYQLDDYFMPPRVGAAQKRDVAKIMSSLELLWPDMNLIFRRHDACHILEELLDHLLSTLLSTAYNPSKQVFEYYLRLLYRVIMPDNSHDDKDPRRQLRRVVMAIVLRHQALFIACGSQDEVRERTDGLKDHIYVDVALLKLINHRSLDAEGVAFSDAAQWAAPFGAVVFAALGGDIATSFLSPWNALAAPIVTTIGFAGSLATYYSAVQGYAEIITDDNRGTLYDLASNLQEQDSEDDDDLFPLAAALSTGFSASR